MVFDGFIAAGVPESHIGVGPENFSQIFVEFDIEILEVWVRVHTVFKCLDHTSQRGNPSGSDLGVFGGEGF